MIQTWLRQCIKVVMDEVFAAAQTQRDVSYQHVADLVGCTGATVANYAGVEWRTRYAALADPQQCILQAIQRLVDAKIPCHEYTWARVYAEVGERRQKASGNEKINQAFRDGFETLTQWHKQQQHQRVSNATYACIQGEWINVDEPIWHLDSIERKIRRDCLRSDIASIAWPLLRKEAISTPISASTLHMHYQNYIALAKLLGTTVPDIRTLTLGELQQVWFNSNMSPNRRRQIRLVLVNILEALITQEATNTTRNVQEVWHLQDCEFRALRD